MAMKGFLTLKSITDRGIQYPASRAVELGLLKPHVKAPSDWGIEPTEVPLGHNMMVDNGRQSIAYLLGNRAPTGSYVISRFGIGTGNTATAATFTDLESPLSFYTPAGETQAIATKPVTGIDFPAPYILRVELTIDANTADGVIITEFGLYSADADGHTTLLCREVQTGYQCVQGMASVFLWRIRP